jgi:hypothetical protein
MVTWLKKKSFQQDVLEGNLDQLEILKNPGVFKWRDEKHKNFSLLHWIANMKQTTTDWSDINFTTRSEGTEKNPILSVLFDAKTVSLWFNFLGLLQSINTELYQH